MAPLGLIFTTALLVFHGVDAKDKISVSQWVSRDCSGHLASKQHDILQGTCKEVNAQSVALHVPGRRKYLDGWLKRVNSGQDDCFATIYPTGGCRTDDPGAKRFEVPAQFEKCLPFPGGVRSIKFHCESKAAVYRAVSARSEITITSYTMDPTDRKPTPIVYTTNAEVTRAVLDSHARSVSPTAQPAVERAAKHDFKHVWYLHPWGGHAMCFECWLRHKKNRDKFQCESTETKNHDCPGKAPDRDMVFTTTNTTLPPILATTTVIPAYVSGSDLEERRERLVVGLTHPFLNVTTCAQAVWKHPGKHSQKLILKGPRRCRGHDYNVDPRRPKSTVVSVAPASTSTVISLHSGISVVAEAETVTVTVYK